MDDSFVYVTTSGVPGGVVRVPRDGGARTSLVSGVSAWGEAIDDSSVYFTTQDPDAGDGGGGGLFRVPKDGGAVETIFTSQAGYPNDIVVDDASVFWTVERLGGTAVLRVAKDGGAPETLATDQQNSSSLVADDSHLYWSATLDGGCPLCGTVIRAAKDGGAAEALTTTAWAYTALAVDDAGVYWAAVDMVDGGAFTSSIVRFDKSSAQTSVVTTSDYVPMTSEGMTVDSSHVVWTFNWSGVLSAPLDGGPATVVAATGNAAEDVVMRDGLIYWIDFEGPNGTPGDLRVLPAPWASP